MSQALLANKGGVGKGLDAHTRDSSGLFGKTTFILNYPRPYAAYVIPDLLGSPVGPQVFISKWTREDL